MQLSFNDKTFEVPSSLSQIKLKQHIAFLEQYGEAIKKEEERITAIQDENERSLELTIYHLDVACKVVSFYSGIPLGDVQQTNINQVLNVYHSCFKQLFQQQDEIELQEKYLWNDEVWVLEQPQINYQSNITFNQFITSKQIVKSLSDLGRGFWDAMPMLAAIFLQKEGEQFNEAMIAEGGERMQAMQDLPMDIALSVAFFLQSSMSLYSSNSAYSSKEEARE